MTLAQSIVSHAILYASMEPVISTSFIPKRPVSSEPVNSSHSSGSVGILSLATIVIVVGTAVAFGGVYLYQQSQISQKAKLQTSITQAQDGLGASFVADMQRLSARIDGVKTLINNHVVVSPVFAALQATTLQTVQYKGFAYVFTSDTTTGARMVEITITGTAKNYATLALQSDAYAQAPIIINPIFSNLVVDDKTQQVGFKLVFTVKPDDLSYTTFINSIGKTAAPLPPAVTSQ